jgi:hypothetical protein
MIKKLAGTLVAAGVLFTFGPPAAQAAPPQPFTITENIDFEAEEFTFAATGALCETGTFEDEVVTVGAGNAPIPKVNLRIRTVYTCDLTGDTFFAQKHVFIAANEDGSSTSTGPITFHGGTGAFAGLSGHGVNIGETSAEGIAVGRISGELKLR